MKIIFLDFDGPIIPLQSHKPERRPMDEKAWPPCVRALNRITDTTGAGIVVSSTWRYGGEQYVTKVLRQWGVTGEVVGLTPRFESTWNGPILVVVERGQEIAAWLDGKTDIESFVILDDDDDMSDLGARLIQTPFEVGLTEADADRAIAMLMEPEGADCFISPGHVQE